MVADQKHIHVHVVLVSGAGAATAHRKLLKASERERRWIQRRKRMSHRENNCRLSQSACPAFKNWRQETRGGMVQFIQKNRIINING